MANDRDFPYDWCNHQERVNLEDNIGKHCRVNDAALKFTKDWLILNKKTHQYVLKSQRVGKITGVTKSGRYYVLWDGNS